MLAFRPPEAAVRLPLEGVPHSIPRVPPPVKELDSNVRSFFDLAELVRMAPDGAWWEHPHTRKERASERTRRTHQQSALDRPRGA